MDGDHEYDIAKKLSGMNLRSDGKRCFAYKVCAGCDTREYMGKVNYRKKPCSCCGQRTAVLSAVVVDFKQEEGGSETG